MRVVPEAKDPLVRSYLELRSAVGWIALGLPLALLLSSWLLPGEHGIPASISAYYYTPMRNVLEGSLCAIGFFNLCARGYEWRDELAGIVSALCALGCAFCPTFPPGGGTLLQERMGTLHNYFAELFFITLAIMCLVLFRSTAANRTRTRNKRRRNLVYTVCGLVMGVCGLFDFICHNMRPIPHIGPLGSIFLCEMIALEAFGVAWLVKGKTFLGQKRRPGNHHHGPPHNYNQAQHPPQPAQSTPAGV
jgi:peptidoglycan/LPS O-acetylase OafA/YrhL